MDSQLRQNVSPVSGTPEEQIWTQRVLWGFIALGLIARCVRYGLRFPLWEDECFLCANLIDRGYVELLQPLDYNQAAPFLFLWLQKLAVQIFGFHEWGLRLVGFVASVGSLFLFRHVASRLTSGWTLVLAVAAFSVGYPAIRYAAEAKQYGADLFAAVALLALFVEWRRHPGQARWLWFLAAAVLPLTMLSFPASFVGGGLSLTILAVAVSQQLHRSPRVVAGWLAYNAAMFGGFLVLWSVSAHGQNAQTGGVMRSYWAEAFPPWTSALALGRWLVVTHASDLLAWPVGGPNGASTFTLICCIVGIAAFVRTRRWAVLGMCLLPAGVNLFAAALRLYPYGGHMRLAIYLGPAACLLLAEGLSDLRQRLFPAPAQRRAYVTSLVVLGLVGLGSIGRDVTFPCKSFSDERARAFAQWFWPSAEFEGDVACLQTDWNLGFVTGATAKLNWGAQYVCNQHIYSRQPHVARPPDKNSRAPDRPLRCVQYRIGDRDFSFDQQAFNRWLSEMQSHYVLESFESYSIPRYDKRDQVLVTVDYIDVLKFIPRPTTTGRGGIELTGHQVSHEPETNASPDDDRRSSVSPVFKNSGQ